jgi:hypothetical protein
MDSVVKASLAAATPDQHKDAAQKKIPTELAAIIAVYQAELNAQTGQSPAPSPTSAKPKKPKKRKR